MFSISILPPPCPSTPAVRLVEHVMIYAVEDDKLEAAGNNLPYTPRQPNKGHRAD